MHEGAPLSARDDARALREAPAPRGERSARRSGCYRTEAATRTCEVVVGTHRADEAQGWRQWAERERLTIEVLQSAQAALELAQRVRPLVKLAVLDGTQDDLPPDKFCEVVAAVDALVSLVYVAESYSADAHRAVMLAGATQFLARPCGVELMFAMAEAELRRGGQLKRAPIAGPWSRLELDRSAGVIRIDDWQLALSRSLLELLFVLASRRGAHVALEELAREALGMRHASERCIRDRIYQQVRRLRRALPDGLRIKEQRGEGYRLVRSA